MTASMLSKVVTAHEASVANRTDKLFLAGVCSPVTGEFIRSSKFFVAALPVTAEWLFTCSNRQKHGSRNASHVAPLIKTKRILN